MPLSVRNSARRRKNADEKLPERPGESTSAQVMAPTRMKLRVRRRDNAAGGAGAAAGGDQLEEEEERSQESGGRSSRRKNANNASTTATATSSSSPPSSSSASVRAVMAAEEASPDSKCPICLDRFNNLAYLDRCLHRFCFPCIQEWSHNKAECPLCKQPFASILHSVRAEDDFKEYTLRPAPANSSVAATVAMVAAMASAARSDHQMRLMLRRHRGADSGESTTRRRRRERGGRGRGGGRAGEGTGVWQWYLDSPPLALPPLPPHPAVSPIVAEDSEDGEDLEEQRMGGGADLVERGVIFEGLTGLGGAVAPVAPNDRASRRLMTRLAARQRLQREGGTVRRLRERETVAFRRTLYRSGIRVRGVAGVSDQGQQQRDITAESFRRNPVHLNRLRPWLRRELTVLYGAHDSLVDIVQRIIMARLARHGLEDTPTVEEELRPFLLARTDHFLHELVSFARSPLSLENYDQQAVYEPPASALELDGTSSSSDSSSVIAISEGEDEERLAGGRSEERLLGAAGGAHDDVIQTGSCLSLSAWDDETPGPSYSTAERPCSLAPLSFSPAPQEAASEAGGEKVEEGEEECLIVGYKKPIAERTPELVQLSSDSEEEEKEDKEKKEEEKTAVQLPLLPPITPPLSYLPTIPPSTSGAYKDKQVEPKEKDGRARARSWSGSSGGSRNSVCTLSPATPGGSERRRDRERWRDRKQPAGESAREKRRRKRSRRRRERSGDRLRKSSTLHNPNRSIYPAMMRHRSHSPSPFHSSVESGSPLPPSPPDSSWEYGCSQVSPLTSSVSSPSRSSSPLSSSPRPLSQTLLMPSRSPSDRNKTHHGEKPGGKRKYKSRHLDSDDKDPTWRPSSSHRREKRRERREKERRRRGRDEGRRRERQRREARRDSSEDSSRRCRDDRSPSVEIIYEGTITSNATQPPARKRRRRRHPKTQHSSSPVIITLDSDSNDARNNHSSSNSSSPLSSQQTVDFSDLPALPLVHSSGVGGALSAEIGELPVDILDRGSDGSETEPAGRSEAADPIAVDNSDNSDHDVDVENVEEGGTPLGSHDGKESRRNTAAPQREGGSMDGDSQQTAENTVTPKTPNLVPKRDSEVSTSDSRLLAAILNDLKEITAPRRDPPSNFEPSCSSDARRKRPRDQCGVSQARPYQDGWLAETRKHDPDLPEEPQSNSSRDQTQGFSLQTFCTSAAPLPPLEGQKECRVREEGKDLPPLLRQASPVRSYNRNTPPPLKHKDAGSPHLSALPPVHLHPSHSSGEAEPVGGSSHVDLHSSPTSCPVEPDVTVPPISTLKRRFTNSLALREELTSTSSVSANDIHSSCHAAPVDSPSAAPSNVATFGIRSSSPRTDPRLTGSESADCLPQLSFSSFHPPKSHSSRDDTKETSAHVDLHSVNSLPPIDSHSAKTDWSKVKWAHSDATSRGYRNQTLSPHSRPAAPVHLHPSSRVSAESTRASGDGFPTFANCSDSASASVFVSSTDSRTRTPPSSTDSHSPTKRENLSETFPPSRVRSVPTAAANGRFLSSDWNPRGPKCAMDVHPSSAASAGLTDTEASSLVAHEERSPHGPPPPGDLHRVPPAHELSPDFVSTVKDEHLNHTASPLSSSFQTLQKKCSSHSKPAADPHLRLVHTTESDSKAHNHFDSSCRPQFPSDACSKRHRPVDARRESQSPVESCSQNSCGDSEFSTDNHITSTSRSAGSHWSSGSSMDAHSESQSPIDQHSASSVWNTHSHTHT